MQAYSLIGWADPLAQCGGCYSVHHSSEPLNRYAQDEIHNLLLASYGFWSCVWGLLAVLSIANLFFRGVSDLSHERERIATIQVGPSFLLPLFSTIVFDFFPFSPGLLAVLPGFLASRR